MNKAKKMLWRLIVVLFIACVIVIIIPKEKMEKGITNAYSSLKNTITEIKMPRVSERPKTTTKKPKTTKKPVQHVVQSRYQKSSEVRRLEARVAELEKEKRAYERAERKRLLNAPIPIPRADYIPVPRADYIPVPGQNPYYRRSAIVVIPIPLGVSGYYGGSYRPNRFIFPGQVQNGIASITKRSLSAPGYIRK